jgi:hypothetical protein
MEDVYGQLVHFMVLCYILWTFGTVRGNLVYFPRFGILYQEKSGNPDFERQPKFDQMFSTKNPSIRKYWEH